MNPQKMTRAEYEQTYGIKPVVSSSTIDTTPAPIKMTKLEYNKLYNPTALTETQERFQDAEQTSKAVNQTMTDMVQGRQRIRQRVTNGEISPLKGVYQTLGTGAGGWMKAGIQTAVGVGKALISQEREDKISDFFSYMSDDAQERFQSDLAKFRQGDEKDRQIATLVDDFSKYIEEDETFRTDVEAAVGLGDLFLSIFGLGAGKTAATKGAGAVNDLVETGVEQTAKVANTASEKLAERSIQKTIDNRVDQLAQIENGYKKTRDANNKANDGGTASRKRIALTDVLVNAVNSDGVLRTKQKGGAVDQYKARTVDGMESVVRNLLEKENKTVNINEVEQALKLGMYRSGLEGADLVSAINGIKREMKGLALRVDEFGNIPLSKVQDFKTSTTANINYLKDDTPTIKQRKAKASTYKTLIEQKSKYPVKRINAVLAEFYEDIARLERLDGTRVEGGRLGKYFASLSGNVVGAAAGTAVGGPVGATLGTILGGEAAGLLKGKAMAGSFGKAAGLKSAPNDILAGAKAEALTKPLRDLEVPDKPVGLSKDIPHTKETRLLEREIKDNVKQQKAAIKAGDFALVATLKEIYTLLVDKLKEQVKFIKENADSEAGFANFVGGDVPQSNKRGKRNTQYQPTTKTSKNVISSTVPEKSDNVSVDIPKGLTADEIDTMRDFTDMQVGAYKATTEDRRELIGQMQDIADKYKFKSSSPKGWLTEAGEILDAVELDKDVFKPQSATTKTTDLLEEAKKYKSADEFVKAQGTSVFRATDKAFDAKLLTDDGLFVSPKKSVAERYLDTGKKIDELVLEKNAKILSFKNTPKALYDMDDGFAIPKDGGDGIEIAKYAKANGYDAVEYGVDPNNLVPEFAIVNKDVIKTKSQLEDIWNKANKPSLLEEAKGKALDEFVRKPRGNEDTLYHYTDAEVGGTLKPRPDVELAEMNYLGDGVYLTNQKNGYEGSNELLAFPAKDLKVLDLTSDAAEERFLQQISKEIGTPVARSGGGLYDDLRLMASNIGENHQKVKDAVSKVSKGYDGIKANFAKYTYDDNYYELVINKDVDVKTPDQLEDIWKQANTKGTDLVEEARKYDSVDEFKSDMVNKRFTEDGFADYHQAPRADKTPVAERMKEGGDFSLSEVVAGNSTAPDDFFDKNVGARYYSYDNLEGRQSETAIDNIRRALKNGITDRTVTAYRTVPDTVKTDELQNGDWVSFSKEYATQHGERRFDGKYKLIEQEVKPDEVWWDANDINEWGYDNGKGGLRVTRDEYEKQLEDIWKQANTKGTDLVEEARKYDSAENYGGAGEYLKDKLNGDITKTSDRYDEAGNFVNGDTTFVSPKGRVELHIKDRNGEIKLFQIIAKEAGTGLGTDIVKALKQYSDMSGKKLTIIKPNDYWRRFDWLSPVRGKDKFGKPLKRLDPDTPVRDQVYYLEYNPLD